MEHVHIAALRPDLEALDSKQIKAVVTLIWPYSSSQRQFALLLAEPDLRLRRHKGQVRARFSSTSARALATTGVGIGDEVVLSLHGARLVHAGAVSTPGKSVDWELAYTQTLAVSVRRNGADIATLELLDAAPTPAPPSPVRTQQTAPRPVPHWSSPAFLKRARLSNGPVFAQPAYDPLADHVHDDLRDDVHAGHDKKRRRKSYRDWKAWTYTARTPSPEKEDLGLEPELDELLSSPSRPPQLPKTPTSPSSTEPVSVAAGAPEEAEYVEETTIADSTEGDTTVDDGELHKVSVPRPTSPHRPKASTGHDARHDPLGLGPDEASLLDSQYDFGGDTELNTEDEDEGEDNTVPDLEQIDGSATEFDAELELGHGQTESEPDALASQPIADAPETVHGHAASAKEEEKDGVYAVAEAEQSEQVSSEVEDTTIDETIPEVPELFLASDDSLAIAMPPPSLPTLNTDFAASTATGVLTPLGKEPSSPNLRAVDSATLPLPSPFPGEQATSYFDNVAADQQLVPLDGPSVEEREPQSDADYIMENSFFSSISSSKAGGLHQDHETVFTPVRFTFGVDGAGWSRPLDLSSPPPQDPHTYAAETKDRLTTVQEDKLVDSDITFESVPSEQPQSTEEITRTPFATTLEEDGTNALENPNETAKSMSGESQWPVQALIAQEFNTASAPNTFSVIALSSDAELDDSEDDEAVEVKPGEEQSIDEETGAESEAEIQPTSVEEHETESEVDDVDDQGLSVDGRVTTELDNPINFESEVEIDAPIRTQASAAVSAIVDLGSPSVDENSDDDHSESVKSELAQAIDIAHDAESEQIADDTDGMDQNPIGTRAESTEEPTAATTSDDFDDFVAMDVVQNPIAAVSSSSDQVLHGSASIALVDTYPELPSPSFDDWEPQLGMDEPLPYTGDHDLSITQVDPGYPDVKMESVKDGSLYMMSHTETQEPHKSTTDPETGLLIGLPKEGHRVGELQFESVPATAPARNTRSRAKSVASPSEEEAYVSRLSTSMRSTRSKASFDLTHHAAVSPPQSRTRSTVTPTPNAMQTSPYSLRSQSTHISPGHSTTPSRAAPVRRSPRMLVRRDGDFDIVPSQSENRDLFGLMFEPSQELGFGYSQTSQSKNSDVPFVKDSEDGISHSEDSLSTVQSSDDNGVQAPTNNNDPVEPVVLESTTPRLKSPQTESSQPGHQTLSRSRSPGERGTVVSPSQPPQSPRRSPRLTRSTFSASPSPRVTRTSRGYVQLSSPTLEEVDEDQAVRSTPKAYEQSVSYLVLPIEGGDDPRSSPLVPDSVKRIPHSSSPTAAPASAQPTTFQESNLLTPDETQQQTPIDPQLSFQARQPEQSLLITPELTQTSSASAALRSFDIAFPGVQTQPVPHSPTTRTSPRRRPAVTELGQSSPIHQSSDAISLAASEDTTLVPTSEPPSIGLSTPLTYYTPLRDLIYFLNRSSQFHSSANPDILALCTTSTTPPERAKKGPRHWNTTFEIADLSTWPEVRRVQCFRAYANALPVAEVGDVVLLRAFAVESRKREPVLRSAEESSWCVWRFGKRVWGAKKGGWGELRAREEVNGPGVERGEGEWKEVERLRSWYVGKVQSELEGQKEEREKAKRGTRSQSKVLEVMGDEADKV